METHAADTWTIGKQTFTSRLLVGTGKYKDFPTMQGALIASGAEVVTVAVRRLDLHVRGDDGPQGRRRGLERHPLLEPHLEPLGPGP